MSRARRTKQDTAVNCVTFSAISSVLLLIGKNSLAVGAAVSFYVACILGTILGHLTKGSCQDLLRDLGAQSTETLANPRIDPFVLPRVKSPWNRNQVSELDARRSGQGHMPKESARQVQIMFEKAEGTMGRSHDEFIKYPRTPHLFGSKGTDDDKHLNEEDSASFIADKSLIVEEKIDGTNVGIHFRADGEMVLQCRGHLITEGMHSQYDLFKQWTVVKRFVLEERLEDRFILFGEWMYARHTIHYRQLPHYFFEFDIYDKEEEAFLSLEQRQVLLEGTGIQTVPVLHTGAVGRKELERLIGPSCFDSQFENPLTKRTDNLMEGLYLRTESDGIVSGRAKYVRPEFVEKIKESTHWQHQEMVPNLLAEGADIWS